MSSWNEKIEKDDFMKIFIGGSRLVSALDNNIIEKLQFLCKNGYEILIGDCDGIDALAQKYLHETNYKNVTVFACNGKARNNLGKWEVKNVPTPQYLYGADYYKKKDIAMAEEADFGYMFWDGKSSGTAANIRELLKRNKRTYIYLTKTKEGFWAANMEYLKSICGDAI